MSSTEHFDCAACREQHTGHSAASFLGIDLCQACFDTGIRSQFEEYLRDETSPVNWAGRAIDIDSVQHQFDASFVAQYRDRMREYTLLPRDRLYCSSRALQRCGRFLGEVTAESTIRGCEHCGANTCSHCGGRILSGSNHTCASPAEDNTNPLQGLARGRDYQVCPVCSICVHREAQCNHMICPLIACEAHFCYICGERATTGPGHWAPGMPCPLDGQPGDVDAQYAHIVPHDDEDVDVFELLDQIQDRAHAELIIEHGIILGRMPDPDRIRQYLQWEAETRNDAEVRQEAVRRRESGRVNYSWFLV